MAKGRMLSDVTAVLDTGWSGEYGQLAALVGADPKAARGVAKCVKEYAHRHPCWPHERVYSKKTGRPAYQT